MQTSIEFKGWTPLPVEREAVQALIARLGRRVARLRLDGATLRAYVEKNEVRTLFRVSLTLEVPGRLLFAQEERHDLAEASREAFTELERQLGKYEDRRRDDDDYKRPERRARLRLQKGALAVKR